MENANEILFRCSSLGELMTKDGKITDGLKTYLTKVYVEQRYSRRKEIKSKYLEKGNIREEMSITLLSILHKQMYWNNKKRLTNQFITGEWDVDIKKGDKIIKTVDTKTSWDVETFHQAQNKESKNYKWQGTGYMWLTGALEHDVAYCLVNGTAKHINEEKHRAKWEFVNDTIDVDLYEPYIERCAEIEKNHIFDMEAFKTENPHFDFSFNLDYWKYDIPMVDRLFVRSYKRDDAEIAMLTGQIIKCRQYMNVNLFKI